jgi:hypothetical protein
MPLFGKMMHYRHGPGDSNMFLTLILRRSNTDYAILFYGNVGRSQLASLTGQNI